MVDFDNETTITVDRSKIISVLILQRHSFVVDSIEKLDRLKYSGANPPTHIVKSSVRALFNQIKATVKMSRKSKYDKIIELVKSEKYEDYITAFEEMDDYLAEVGLTKFILNRDYDPRDPLAEDEAKGL